MTYSFIVRAVPTVLFSLYAQEEAQKVFTPWYIYLVLIAFLIFDLWLIFSKKAHHTFRHPKWKLETPAEETAAEPPAPDDFKIIEGIGPVINKILHEAGIHKFSELADMQSEAIKEIVVAGGVRLVDTSTWPNQAILAAEGKFDDLKVYQATIN